MAEQMRLSDRYLRRPEVERQTGLSRATIYRQMKAGAFPKRHRLATQAVGWLASEIEEWQRQRPILDHSE